MAVLKKVFHALPAPVRRVARQWFPRLLAIREHRNRNRIAARYLSGQGIEIGALHAPLRAPRGAAVRYVDRMTVSDLRKHYPELADAPLVEVDIVDNGEQLFSVPEASADFVIASHLIEHTQDPISALRNWFRVIRPGGILFLVVPDKRHTFDRDRPATSLAHLVRDHTDGAQWSRRGHFEEWARLVNKVAEPEVETRARELMESDLSIHFHVWTELEFLEPLLYCRKHLSMPFSFELMQRNGGEFIAVLRKERA